MAAVYQYQIDSAVDHLWMSTQSKFNALELLARIRAANATPSSESKSNGQVSDDNNLTRNSHGNNFQKGIDAAALFGGNSNSARDTNFNPVNSFAAKNIHGSYANNMHSDIPSEHVIPSIYDRTKNDSFAAPRNNQNNNMEYLSRNRSDIGNNNYQTQNLGYDNVFLNNGNNQNGRFTNIEQQPSPSAALQGIGNNSYRNVYDLDDDFIGSNDTDQIDVIQYNNPNNNHRTNQSDNNNNPDNNNNANNNANNSIYHNSRYNDTAGSDEESLALCDSSSNNRSIDIRRNFNANRDFDSSNFSDAIVPKNSPFTEELYEELHRLRLENIQLTKKNKSLILEKNDVEKSAHENKTKNEDIIATLRCKYQPIFF